MTAKEALDDMRRCKNYGDPLPGMWADAIEAELAAKEEKWREAILENGALQSMNASLNLDIQQRDARIAELEAEVLRVCRDRDYWHGMSARYAGGDVK